MIVIHKSRLFWLLQKLHLIKKQHDAITGPGVVLTSYNFDHEYYTQLMYHEEYHVKQWMHYWIIGLPFVYLWHYFRTGHDKHPFEIEAWAYADKKWEELLVARSGCCTNKEI